MIREFERSIPFRLYTGDISGNVPPHHAEWIVISVRPLGRSNVSTRLLRAYTKNDLAEVEGCSHFVLTG